MPPASSFSTACCDPTFSLITRFAGTSPAGGCTVGRPCLPRRGRWFRAARSPEPEGVSWLRSRSRRKIPAAPGWIQASPQMFALHPVFAVGAAACPRPAALGINKNTGSANSYRLRIRRSFPLGYALTCMGRRGRRPLRQAGKPFALLGQLAETGCTPPWPQALIPFFSALLSHFPPKRSGQVKAVVFDLFVIGQSNRFGPLGSSLLQQEKLLKGQVNLMCIRAGCDPGSL